MDAQIGIAFIVGAGWMLSLCLHEFGHAIVAYAGGDKSVKDKGYLTLNPVKYTDPGLSLILPLIILMIGGIALPGAAVYIDRRKLRNRIWHSLVSFAGPLANMIRLGVIAIPFLLGMNIESDSWVWPGLAALALFQAVAIILNLIPLPPTDGFGVIEPWLPLSVRQAANRFGNYGIWILFAVLWFVEPVNRALWTVAYSIVGSLQIPLEQVQAGCILFKKQSYLLLVFVLLSLVVWRGIKRK